MCRDSCGNSSWLRDKAESKLFVQLLNNDRRLYSETFRRADIADTNFHKSELQISYLSLQTDMFFVTVIGATVNVTDQRITINTINK